MFCHFISGMLQLVCNWKKIKINDWVKRSDVYQIQMVTDVIENKSVNKHNSLLYAFRIRILFHFNWTFVAILINLYFLQSFDRIHFTALYHIAFKSIAWTGVTHSNCKPYVVILAYDPSCCMPVCQFDDAYFMRIASECEGSRKVHISLFPIGNFPFQHIANRCFAGNLWGILPWPLISFHFAKDKINASHKFPCCCSSIPGVAIE